MMELSNNEPPRFGLESRGRKRDVNTRQLKQLQRAKQQLLNEKGKKEAEKKRAEVEEKKLKSIPSPQPGKHVPSTKPILVFGTDNKESLYPQSQDIDADETILCKTGDAIFTCKKIGQHFQDEVILSRDPKESVDIQKAIEQSFKLNAGDTVDNTVKAMEEEFEILCEEEYDDEDEYEEEEEEESWDNTIKMDELENWELLDEGSSTALVNFITTPYSSSDRDFPLLPLRNSATTLKLKCNINKIDASNPWNQTKTLIEAIQST